ncbi:conserved hypothetical protein, putative [Verrucomicrobiia bacterium DG1235]|nr:conserved hypothetical protein, putative [Verrucomicrobiae bacterium DG1235]
MKILLIIPFLFLSTVVFGDQEARHRMIVLTDMGADPDDEQSLVRLLLYANQIDIEGIVATTSCWHQDRIRPDFIEGILSAYEKVQPNLLKHEDGYPTAKALRKTVKEGIPKYGMEGVGEGMDTEGSDWIIEVLERDDERPLWISVWGGPNVLAQALYKIDKTRSKKEADKLISKLRVYTISDQDDSAMWMRKEFPNLFYIVTPTDDYGKSTWIAINNNHEGADNSYVSNPWLEENIQQGHGPLGARYPDTSWGFEGDTPAFLGLIPNGLNNLEKPNWGSWGGRYELSIPDVNDFVDGGSVVVPEPETRPIWTDTSDIYTPYRKSEFKRAVEKSEESYSGNAVTLWRWREDFQNDFAARMDWSTMSYEEANHPPVVHLNHPNEITVKSGQGFSLDAYGSSDPDGDSISFLWFHYPEAGTYKTFVPHNGAENFDRVNYTAPKVEKEETMHIILKLSDKGTPALSRYARVVVTVQP